MMTIIENTMSVSSSYVPCLRIISVFYATDSVSVVTRECYRCDWLSWLEQWWRRRLSRWATVVIFWQRPNISSLESFFAGRPRLNVVGFVEWYVMYSKMSELRMDCWIPRLALRQRFVYTLKTFVATVELRKWCNFSMISVGLMKLMCV